MQLSVLNIASPFAPVGPDALGGAERVLTQLDEALVHAGHDSIVMACEGSGIEGILVSMPRQGGALNDPARRRTYDQYRIAIQRLLTKWRFDLIHMHGMDFYEYLPPVGVPVLATLHYRADWYPHGIFKLDRPQTYLHCISPAQRQACPPCPYLLPEIGNGVTLDQFSSCHAKRDYTMGLGPISFEQGFHLALEAALRAKVPTLLAGELFHDEEHESYFQNQIAPRLDGSHRFLGSIGLKRKRRLLAGARCLLAPSLVPETSSFAAMEALASGTPVVAFASGALADIVEPGKTGYLVKNAEEMADAIRAVDSIDREACREAARERFSLERTLENYFAIYHQLAREMVGLELWTAVREAAALTV